jgi:hypothetical protein
LLNAEIGAAGEAPLEEKSIGLVEVVGGNAP